MNSTSPSRYAHVKSTRPKPPPVPLETLSSQPREIRSSEDTDVPSHALPPLQHGPMSPRHRNLSTDPMRSLLSTLSSSHRPTLALDGTGEVTEMQRSPIAVMNQLSSVGRDYPVAQLDSWPLTTNAAPPYHSTTSLSPASSPLSPRARKSHAHHKLIDDSKSRPQLLQELYAHLHSSLAAIGQQVHAPEDTDTAIDATPNLQRLQVFRELFHRLIASFNVYAPLLAQIQDEYERVVQALVHKAQLLPRLHGELQSLEAQCLHEISKQQLESTRLHRSLKQTLKDTQAKLAACAADNAHLEDDKLKLLEEIRTLQQRKDEMQLSNQSLVNGIRRQDDTLRHIHERSREEGMALSQMTMKYHRACEEIAELKVTVATLEEKVGGVHVAADKATIALLTKDLQETHSKLQVALASSRTIGAEDLSGDLAPAQAMAKVMLKVLDANGVAMKQKEIIDTLKTHSLGLSPSASRVSSSQTVTRMNSAMSVTASSSSLVDSPSRLRLSSAAKVTRPVDQVEGNPLAGISLADVNLGIDRLAASLTEKIAQYHQQNNQLAHRSEHQSPQSSTTFLTEPEELGGSFQHANTQILTRLLGTTDYIQAKGLDSDVPEYLQYEGVVRQLYYDRRRVETVVAKVWAHKDDLEGKAKRNSIKSGGVVPLARVFTLYLQRCFSSKHEAVECAYNMVASLERFAQASSDCRLFLLTLQGQLPDEARSDQVKELYTLHDVLFTIHREQKNQSSTSQTGLPLPEVIRALRRHYPWKSESQLSQLHRALLMDLRGHSLVDYSSLLLPHDPPSQHVASLANQRQSKRRSKPQFCECLRAQYIDDLLVYRNHLQQAIQQTLVAESSKLEGSATEASGNMLSIRVLRDCLQRGDQAKPVQDINRLIHVATGLTMDQILTQDAMMVSVTQFLDRLPTLLVKPSGKFSVIDPAVTESPTTDPVGDNNV